MAFNISDMNTVSSIRPKWSVMIPAYGRGQFLEQTLRSVLAQDPGSESMQIAVVENPSEHKEIKKIVERVAGERVEYYINSGNLGMVGNWNRCIDLVRGEFVHILHDDDWVLPGFYIEIERMVLRRPVGALYATRVLLWRERESVMEKSPRVLALEAGGSNYASLIPYNPLYCPGVVVRKSFYTEDNVFDADLVFSPDWEMWVRAIRSKGGIVSDQALAVYRKHEGSSTSRLAREAGNLDDFLRLRIRWCEQGLDVLICRALDRVMICMAEDQMIRFASLHNWCAVRNSWVFWRRLASWRRYPIFCARWLRAFVQGPTRE